jgi:phytoene/squalene synthetase
MPKPKRVTVVLQDTDSGIYTSVFSTPMKARKAVANVIFRRVDEVEDEEVQREIKQAYEEKEWEIVMQAWNAWSVETEYRDEYAIEIREMDKELAS